MIVGHTFILTNEKGQKLSVQAVDLEHNDPHTHGHYLTIRAYHKYGGEWTYQYVGTTKGETK